MTGQRKHVVAKDAALEKQRSEPADSRSTAHPDPWAHEHAEKIASGPFNMRRRSSLAWLEAYRGAYARATSGSSHDADLTKYLASLDERIKTRRAEEGSPS